MPHLRPSGTIPSDEDAAPDIVAGKVNFSKDLTPLSNNANTPSSSTGVTATTAGVLTPTGQQQQDAEEMQRLKEQHASAAPAFHPMILCPLYNLGNTCYFNSGIQLLANCPAFVYGLRDSPFCPRPLATGSAAGSPTNSAALHQEERVAAVACALSHSGGNASHTLFRSLAKLLHDMEYNQLKRYESLTPLSTLDCLARVFPAFEGRSQQDCTEMVTAVIATVEDEGRLVVDVEVLLRSLEKDADNVCQGDDMKSTAAAAARERESGGEASHEPTCSSNYVSVTRSSSSNAEGDRLEQDQEEQELYSLPTVRTQNMNHALAAPNSAQLSGIRLPGPRSSHFFSTLRLMHRVNQENAALEKKARERKGLGPSLSAPHTPKLFMNAATGGFTGYSLSEITCHACRNTSRVVTPFTSLMLDIPSSAQRRQYAQRHPDVRRTGPDGEPLQSKRSSGFAWLDPLSYLLSIKNFLARLFGFGCRVNYPLTLQECLDIHFEPAELKGSNKYQCDACGTVGEATKKESLLAMPEYLLVHMKRFSAGSCFNAKKTDPVIFPVSWSPLSAADTKKSKLPKGTARPEILDLRAYAHETLAKDIMELPKCLQVGSANSSKGNANPTDAAADEAGDRNHNSAHVVSTYSLDGVVNHHGSYGGGHYTVFTRKRSAKEDMWVYLSDEEVTSANLTEVADSEEYLLLYKRQAVVEQDVTLRDKARYYLAQQKNQNSDDAGCVYISRPWLEQAAFLSDPGPILNELCYCSEKDKQCVTKFSALFPSDVQVPQQVPHVHGPPVEWFYVPIARRDYDAFFSAYGGNAPVIKETYERIRKEQELFLKCVGRQKALKGRQGSDSPPRF